MFCGSVAVYPAVILLEFGGETASSFYHNHTVSLKEITHTIISERNSRIEQLFMI